MNYSAKTCTPQQQSNKLFTIMLCKQALWSKGVPSLKRKFFIFGINNIKILIETQLVYIPEHMTFFTAQKRTWKNWNLFKNCI